MAQYDPQRSRSRPRNEDDEGPAPVDALLGDAPEVPVGSPVVKKAPVQKSVVKKSVVKKSVAKEVSAKKSAAQQSVAKKAPAKKPATQKSLVEHAAPVTATPVAEVAAIGDETPVVSAAQPSVADPGPGWPEPRSTPTPTPTMPARSSRRVPVVAIVAAVLALTGLVWWRRRARGDEG